MTDFRKADINKKTEEETMKKKLLALLTAVLMLTVCLTPLFAQAMTRYERGYYYVNTNDTYGLKLRTSPEKTNGDTNLITKIPHRFYVLVYEFNANKTWAYIEVTDPRYSDERTVKGWCMTSYLTEYDPGPVNPVKPGPTTTPAPQPTFDEINNAARAIRYNEEPYLAVIITRNAGNYVHLRWFPSTSASYIDKYLAGEQVMVLAESKTWAQVMDVETGYVGFVLRANVQEVPVVGDETVNQ